MKTLCPIRQGEPIVRQFSESPRSVRIPARWLLLLFVLVFMLVGCDDGVQPRGPGDMTAVLDSPNEAEGAMLVELVGEGIGQARGASGPYFVEAFGGEGSSETSGVRAIVLHQTGGELRISFELDDRDELPVVQVIEVAGPDDELRGDLSEYSVDWVEGVQ